MPMSLVGKKMEEYDRCETVQSFINHPGYKCAKYKQALEYIRAHGQIRLRPSAILNA